MFFCFFLALFIYFCCFFIFPLFHVFIFSFFHLHIFDTFFLFSFLTLFSLFFLVQFFHLLFLFLFLFFFFGCSKSVFWASIASRILKTFKKKNLSRRSQRGTSFPFLHLFHFFIFPIFCFSSKMCFFFFSKKNPLPAFKSGFNKICFLRSRCSMEMWCRDDTGRASWDWVGPPAWGRA